MNHCRCVIVAAGNRIYCHEQTGDRPFCDACEDRHPEKDLPPTVRIARLPLGFPHPAEIGAALGEEVPF